MIGLCRFHEMFWGVCVARRRDKWVLRKISAWRSESALEHLFLWKPPPDLQWQMPPYPPPPPLLLCHSFDVTRGVWRLDRAEVRHFVARLMTSGASMPQIPQQWRRGRGSHAGHSARGNHTPPLEDQTHAPPKNPKTTPQLTLQWSKLPTATSQSKIIQHLGFQQNHILTKTNQCCWCDSNWERYTKKTLTYYKRSKQFGQRGKKHLKLCIYVW